MIKHSDLRHRSIQSSLRALAVEMKGEEKEMVHQKKWAFNWFLKFCRVSDDRFIAGSLFHDDNDMKRVRNVNVKMSAVSI